MAVMVCEPAPSVDTVQVAVPNEAATLHDPIVVPPSLKSTVPAGVPEPGVTAETVALNVTDCPEVDGLTLDVSDTDVDAGPTFWLSEVEVEARKLGSPL